MQEPNSPLIDSLLTHAAQAARTLDSQSLAEILDAIPAAVYTTDAQGRLTHFNRAAVEFSGRVPTLGTDQWCVTWKLYHADGRPLPHDECPMAVALKEGRPIRGVEAIAERPDGRRIAFLPFPTPLKDDAGRVVGGVNMLLDISERKRVEAALLASEARFRQLVAMMPAGVYTTDASSARITFFNDKAVEIWGRRPRTGDDGERFCGSFRLWRPDGSALRHEDTPMALAMREGRSFRNVDAVIERPDGSRVPVLVNIDPMRDENGAVRGAVNVFLDTTALQQAKNELLRRTRQLSAFLETAAIALHRVGPDGIILWANEAELQMLGYPREEYIGHHIAEFHADHSVISDILNCLSGGKKLRDYEARLRCKDGSVRTVLIDSSVYWEEGKFVHTQCFTRDITEQRRAQELRSRIAAIVESSEDAIVGTDLRGIITSWNRGAARLYGYRADEAVGRHIALIIPEELVAEQENALERLRRGEHLEHFETSRRAKDGRRIAVSLAVSPIIGGDGAIIGTSRVARDITERKRAEAEREEEGRRKDEFLATLSHELRNPLAPIRNAVDLLAKVGDNPAIRRDAQAILDRQVKQMAKLVDDLMELTRVSRGMLTPDKRDVALADIVQSAVEMSRPLIDGARHRLTVVVPEPPVVLHADPMRIAQVLSNLLNNAAKYTPSEGAITLDVSLAGEEARISVRDTGIGIDPAALPQLFEMFSRAGAGKLSGQSGLGIGLAIARSLARLHDGDIEARSDGVGKGSEFVVRLPLARSKAPLPAAARADAAPAAVTPRRVLIADDNIDAASTTALILRHVGHEVRTVHDGHAALRAVYEQPPEVLLLDLSLPGLDGYAVAARLRADARLKGVRIVALTGHGLESHRARSRQAGFDEHLVKPVDPETLARAVSSLH
ncbi:MAG TPA: PAS domain S-box protein [Burkholderiales bacterium]|nr:PAS domain S-box protein [Burkholderiales bacterium]